MKTTTCLSKVVATLLVAGAALRPMPARAQQPARADSVPPRVHVVQPGETLWSLARQYLGDPWAWRKLVVLGDGSSRPDSTLKPGYRVQIPSNHPSNPTGSDSGTGAAVFHGGIAQRVSLGSVALTSGEARASSTTSPTVFFGTRFRSIAPAPTSDSAQPNVGDVRQTRPSPARYGAASRTTFAHEASAAPFVSEPGGPAGAGKILGRVGTQGNLPYGANIGERVRVALPAHDVAKGTRLLSFRLGSLIAGVGQLAMPTAELTITSRDSVGTAEAVVVAQYDVVAIGDALIAPQVLTRATLSPSIQASEQGRVVCIAGNALLPTVQHTIILDLTSRDGVAPGEYVTLFTVGRRVGRSSERVDQHAVGVAQVLRVSERGSTAIILNHTAPIECGMHVRRVGVLP